MALTESEALQAVKAVIADNGGEVDHDTLMGDLIARGAFEARPLVRQFVGQGRINARLVAQPQGRPVLSYTDADAQPAQPNQPAPSGGTS
jgi:hypothetical protein